MTSNDEQILKGKRILVVDDEWLIGFELVNMLEAAGGKAYGPAKTIADARDCIENEKLDAALLDANLDGFSSEPIAELLSHYKIPFAVVSGYGDLGLDGPLLQAAARVDKPFSEHSILTVLNKLLAHQPQK